MLKTKIVKRGKGDLIYELKMKLKSLIISKNTF